MSLGEGVKDWWKMKKSAILNDVRRPCEGLLLLLR
jgi:hypothetical protein